MYRQQLRIGRMRKLQLVLLLFSILLNPLCLAGPWQETLSAQTPLPDQKGTVEPLNFDDQRRELEQGIKHVLVSQVEAWNKGNIEGFMEGYWNSPDLTFISGADIVKGWQPTLERYRRTYQQGGNEMGHLEFQDLTIDLLSRRAAAVTGKWGLTMSTGKHPHGVFTLIFKRMPGGWKIVQDHTSSAAQ
jgi:ketosteroid isomerase-like protein